MQRHGSDGKFLSLDVKDVQSAERRVCRRVWETLQEFQDGLFTPVEIDLVDRLEMLLRENLAYSREES